MTRISDAIRRCVAWFAGFFEEGTTGRPSSKRLQAIAGQFVALLITAALAGVAVGLAMGLRTDAARAMEALRAILTTIEVMTGMTIIGGGGTYLLGKKIERGGSKPSGGGDGH